MNLPGQYVQCVLENLEVGQLKYVKPVEIDLDKEKTMKKILTQYNWKTPMYEVRKYINNPKGLGSKKRGKDGRFQQHIYTLKFKGDRLSLLSGIFYTLLFILILIWAGLIGGICIG